MKIALYSINKPTRKQAAFVNNNPRMIQLAFDLCLGKRTGFLILFFWVARSLKWIQLSSARHHVAICAMIDGKSIDLALRIVSVVDRQRSMFLLFVEYKHGVGTK